MLRMIKLLKKFKRFLLISIFRLLEFPKTLLVRIKYRTDFWYLIRQGVETKLGYVRLEGKPIIRKHPNSRIVIDKKVTLVSDSKSNIAGINHPVILATCSENATIYIGENTGISGASIVAVNQIKIGCNVGLGANSNLYDTDFHPIDAGDRYNQKNISEAKSAPIEIGDNVWVGANTTVLKGVKIGHKSVIGCSSLVTKSIEKNEFHAGNPAKFIRKLL